MAGRATPYVAGGVVIGEGIANGDSTKKIAGNVVLDASGANTVNQVMNATVRPVGEKLLIPENRNAGEGAEGALSEIKDLGL